MNEGHKFISLGYLVLPSLNKAFYLLTMIYITFPPWSGIFFKLARCGYTLRVTSQASYSPEYITSTQKDHVYNQSINQSLFTIFKYLQAGRII